MSQPHPIIAPHVFFLSVRMGKAGGGGEVRKQGGAVGFSCCRLRHGTRGVPFCAARQMWLTCGHLSAKPPGCTMAWLCVCVCRGGGNGRAVGLASERSHSLCLSLSPPLLPSFLLLAAHNPSVIVSFFFISLPRGAVWSD